jgi:hypothetical protein
MACHRKIGPTAKRSYFHNYELPNAHGVRKLGRHGNNLPWQGVHSPAPSQTGCVEQSMRASLPPARWSPMMPAR